MLRSEPVRCLAEPIEAREEKIRYERLVMWAEPAFNFRLAQQATRIEPRADIGQSGDGHPAGAGAGATRGADPRGARRGAWGGVALREPIIDRGAHHDLRSV